MDTHILLHSESVATEVAHLTHGDQLIGSDAQGLPLIRCECHTVNQGVLFFQFGHVYSCFFDGFFDGVHDGWRRLDGDVTLSSATPAS